MTSTPTLAPTQTMFQTVETTGTIDENGVLRVAPLVGVPAGRVRVLIMWPPRGVVTTSSIKQSDSTGDTDLSEDGRNK